MDNLPIAIIMPHTSLQVPPELAGRIALTEAQIFNEADVYIDQIFGFRERVLYWLRFPYARAAVDVNRPDDPGRTRPGDGIVKWQTSYGTAVYPPEQQPDETLTRQLVERYWRPWHAQLARVAADDRVKLVIDAHSMAAIGPAKYDDPKALRPRVSVSNLGGPDGALRPGGSPYLSAPPAPTLRLAEILGELFADVVALTGVGTAVTVNNPFFGGWDLAQHAPYARQPWMMIEVNRALYVGAQHGDSPPVPSIEEQIAVLREKMWLGLSRFVQEL